MSEKQSRYSVKSPGRGGARPGAGRPRGSLDKGNKAIREMIVEALDEVGGVTYLASLAKSHPSAFVSLVGKVMPIQVTGEDGGPIRAEHTHHLMPEDAYKQMLNG